MDHAFQGDTSSNYPLDRGFRAIWDNFRVHMTIAFEQAKHNRFASCATASDASDTASAEVTFVYFNFAFHRTFRFAESRNSFSQSGEIPVYSIAIKVGKLGDLRGVQINGKKPYNLANFGL